MATHTRSQLECSAVTKFGIEFSLDNIQFVSEIATVIRRIASAIFDQARPQLADGEGAPGGLSRLAEMESMWAPEHSHIPVPRGTPFPGGGDVPKPYEKRGINTAIGLDEAGINHDRDTLQEMRRRPNSIADTAVMNASQLEMIGYLAKISSARLNALSTAFSGAIPSFITSNSATLKRCSEFTWAMAGL